MRRGGGGGGDDINDDADRRLGLPPSLSPWQRAYLAVGPNLGDRHRNDADALVALASHSDV